MPQHRDDEPNDDLRARVGDLALHVENGFNRVDANLLALRQEMGQQRAEFKGDLREQSQEMKREIRGLRMLIYGSASSLFLTVVAAQLLG